MLTPNHLDELRNSCIDQDIAALNFQSIDGSNIYQYLCYSQKLERRNDGRLAQKWLNRYSHCESGGWWCSGLDPLDDWQPMEWGVFKPGSPKQDYQKPGKFIKYEHPPQVETRAFFLRVPLSIWEQIAISYSLALPENIVVDTSGEALGFWAWVLDNPKIPVIIVEGAKKAGCLLTHNFVALALPGIFNGYRSKDAQGNKINPYLIPDLKALAQKGREIRVCFDCDAKQQTTRNVNIATSQLGRLLQAEGCEVAVINLPGPEKGVDDFLQARGVDAFSKIYENATPLSAWQIRLFRQLSYKPDVAVTTKFLNDLDDVYVPDSAKLVVFRAPKGSGKTEAIAQLCEKAYHQDQPVIVLTYREQLGKELARRFKLPYKTEIWNIPERTLYGFTLCVDSVHPQSEAKFQAVNWGNALVVIDEVESVVWHLLNSATCIKNRLPILEEVEVLFAEVLRRESLGRIVLADADLSDLTVDFVKGLAGQPTLKPYVIRSDYKPETGWNVFSYQTPTDLYAALKVAIAEGGKHIIFTGGQRVTSKWGAQNLEKDLQFPNLRILRIDKETVADPNHPAYGCIDDLNVVLPEWDVVIASPVIESGVSIDLYKHFTAVWGFSSGVIPTDNVRQTLARVRDINVPRHIWATDRGLPSSFIGNGTTSPAALRNGELKKSKVNFQTLIEAGVTVDADGSVQTNTIALETWLKMASCINAGFHNYRKTILADLEAEGHSVTQLGFQLEPEAGKRLSESMANSRNELAESEAKKIADTTPPQSEGGYEKLKAKKTKTPQERRSQVNYEMQQRYAAPPDADTILKDWDGWYPQIRLHYYLTVGNQYLSTRDEKRFTDIARDGYSWVPDSNRVLIGSKVAALQVLGLDKLFVEGVDWSQDSPEIQAIVNKALDAVKDVKLFLGVSVTSKNTSMATVQKLLDQTMGFRLKKSGFIEKGVDSNGKRQRIRTYQFVPPKDGRGEVFQRWLLRDGKSLGLESVTSSEQMDHQTPIDLYKGSSDPKPGDPSPELESVTSSEQMDHQTPIDLYKGSSDPKPGDPSLPEPENIPPVNREGRWFVGQRVQAWLWGCGFDLM